VSHNAPIIVQETNDDFTNVEAKDHILAVDFDGNFIGADNYDNAFDPTRVQNGEATIYYSASETGSASDRGYYYLGFYIYHPGDGGVSFESMGAQWVAHGHEHDLEGAYFIVKKTPWSPYGELQVALTQAHGALLPYKKANATYVGNNVPAGGPFMGFINLWYDQTFATWRPVVAVRSRTHGTYIAQDCSAGAQPIDLPFPWGPKYGMDATSPSGTYISCIHSGHHSIIYSPVPTNVAPSSGIWPQRLGPTFHNGFSWYRLIQLSESPIWTLRQNWGQPLFGPWLDVGDGTYFGYGYFANSGSDHGGGVDPYSYATTPWEWKGGVGATHTTPSGPGAWYSFGADNSGATYDPHHWPESPVGRLLGNPNSENASRFPFLPQLAEQVVYNPYGYVPQPPTPQPLSASIMGPESVVSGVTNTWQAAASGGTQPYTYQWSGPFSGSDEFISGALYADSILYLDVWDAVGGHVAVSLSITVSPSCGGYAC
jgi:hypothetical protein